MNKNSPMKPIIRGSHPLRAGGQGSGVGPPPVIGNTSASDAGEERPVYLLDCVRSSEFLYFPICLISHSIVYPGLNFFSFSFFCQPFFLPCAFLYFSPGKLARENSLLSGPPRPLSGAIIPCPRSRRFRKGTRPVPGPGMRAERPLVKLEYQMRQLLW